MPFTIFKVATGKMSASDFKKPATWHNIAVGAMAFAFATACISATFAGAPILSEPIFIVAAAVIGGIVGKMTVI